MFTAGLMATPGSATRKLRVTVSLAGLGKRSLVETEREPRVVKEPTFVGQVCVETRAFVYAMRQGLALESGNGESNFKECVRNGYQLWSKHQQYRAAIGVEFPPAPENKVLGAVRRAVDLVRN